MYGSFYTYNAIFIRRFISFASFLEKGNVVVYETAIKKCKSPLPCKKIDIDSFECYLYFQLFCQSYSDLPFCETNFKRKAMPRYISIISSIYISLWTYIIYIILAAKRISQYLKYWKDFIFCWNILFALETSFTIMSNNERRFQSTLNTIVTSFQITKKKFGKKEFEDTKGADRNR